MLLGLAGLALLTAVGMPATIYVPDNFATIQGAIDASSNGDEIIVRAGMYVENIDFKGKAIHLNSEQGAAVTTIDGNQAGCVVFFDTNEGKDSILEGFTITNGSGYVDLQGEVMGGGIYCNSASPLIISNVIHKNDTADRGGGIYCISSEAEVDNNEITENTAYTGGGAFFDEVSNLTLNRNTVKGNSSFITGGVVVTDSTSVLISNNHFEKNDADRHGCVRYYRSTGEIDNNTFVDNNYNISCGQITINRCDDEIAVENNELFMTSIQSNTKGIYCKEAYETSIIRNKIYGHGAIQGGGINIDSCSPYIASNIVEGNVAQFEGGGVYGERTDAIFVNNVIVRNEGWRGGGMSFDWHSSPNLKNNTIVDNIATEYGGGVHGCNASAVETIRVANTILWGNDAPQGPEIALMGLVLELDVHHSDVAGGQTAVYVENNCVLKWGVANIDVDPQFVDSSVHDYHLTWDSPCREAGDFFAVWSTYDFEDDPRIAGESVDMGADEYYYHLYHTGDQVPGGNIDLKVIGYPQAPVTLAWGQTILDTSFLTQHGELYIWPFVWSGFIGNVQPDGVLSMPVTIPTGWQPGDHAPLQALVGPWGNSWAKLTNLMDLIVE